MSYERKGEWPIGDGFTRRELRCISAMPPKISRDIKREVIHLDLNKYKEQDIAVELNISVRS